MRLEKFFLYGTYFALFAVLFTPLIFSSKLFFPFIVGKNVAFRILVDLAFLFWVGRIFVSGMALPKKSLILYVYAGLLFILILSTIFGLDPYRSFWSNYERMEGLITYLHLFAFFLVASSLLTTEKLWSRFFHTSLGVSILVSIYSLGQLFGKLQIFQSSERLEATFGNSTYLAVYLLFHIFIAAYYLISNYKSRAWRGLFYVGVMMLELVILFLTETRGVVIGLLAGVFFFAFLNAFFNKGIARKVGVGLLVSAVVVIGTFVAVRDTGFVKESRMLRRLSTISLSDSSVNARFTVWEMALEGFQERPILGWGLDHFPPVFNKYYRASLYTEEPWFDRAHNVFLDWLIHAGILGLLFYLGLFAVAFYYLLLHTPEPQSLKENLRRVFRGEKNEAFTKNTILASLLFAYFTQNIFVFDNLGSHVLFVSVLAYLHALYGKKWESVSQSVARVVSRPALGGFIFILLTAFFFWGGYSAHVKPILAGNSLIRAITPPAALAQQQIDQAVLNAEIREHLDLFKKAINYNTFGTPEIREHLVLLASQLPQVQGIDPTLLQEFMEYARSEMEKEINDRPYEARYPLFLGTYLAQFGRFSEALPYLETARGLSPNKVQIIFPLANVYAATGDILKAVALAEEAYLLDPQNPESVRFYASALLIVGEEAKAKEVLVRRFGEEEASQILGR